MKDARRALRKRSHRQLIMLTTKILTLWAILAHSTRAALTMHPMFFETNMKAAWGTLLDVGDGGYEGARELIGEMLGDCNGRASAAWGKECDHALYLEAVLERAIATATSGGAMDADKEEGASSASVDRADAAPEAQDVAVVSDTLPFSAFFLEYAVPRQPVIFPQQQPLLAAAHIVESSEEGVTTAADDGEDMSSGEGRGKRDSSGWSSTSPSNSAGATVKEDGALFDQEVLDLITECVPYRAGELTGTADGPLRPCEAALLETLSIPRYVAADFVQRFRARDAVPAKDHPEVEQFASG